VFDPDPTAAHMFRRLCLGPVTGMTEWRDAAALLQGGARFDFVFAECGIDGLEVLRAAAVHCPAARRVLMMPGLLDARIIVWIRTAASELIEKPVWPDDARALIERACGRAALEASA